MVVLAMSRLICFSTFRVWERMRAAGAAGRRGVCTVNPPTPSMGVGAREVRLRVSLGEAPGMGTGRDRGRDTGEPVVEPAGEAVGELEGEPEGEGWLVSMVKHYTHY